MTDFSDTAANPAYKAKFPERAARWQRIQDAVCRTHKQRLTAEKFYQLPEPLFLPENIGRIAFVSDLHYTGSPKCRKILDEILTSLKNNPCTLLLLGGDICSDGSKLQLLPEVLGKLSRCAEKCIAIPGNWERGKCWLPEDYWEKLYSSCGIEFLLNRSIRYGNITITGVDDTAQGFPELPEKFSPDSFNILLAHRPDTVIYLDEGDALENCGFTLCGHTHAGQIRVFRGLLPASKYGSRFDYGFFRKNEKNLMYVSSGTGELSFPWRINAPREIVYFS